VAASSSAGDAREPELEDQRGGQQHTDHGYERKRGIVAFFRCCSFIG
jgi:hypothetical protein